MFDCGIVIIFLFGLLLYSTRDDSRFMFCLRTGCGVMFFSSSRRDSRISSLLLFFSDSFSLPIFVYSLSFLFVNMLNYFYILSIFAISIRAMFFGLLIFYSFRFLLPDKIGFCTFMRSLMRGSLIYGEFLRWRGTFIIFLSISLLKLYNFFVFLFIIFLLICFDFIIGNHFSLLFFIA